ncbi:TetR/AcrR family transcriptional regulator C-terminal domain-containing protein [Mesorhizobium sp. M0622]|uniref:TetR/AcrR family transcriptional regulator C-terminal domain-containing protein n=1 Tax=unclassified Mesorhizobium TaxID=325217 RepID=UPI003339245D
MLQNAASVGVRERGERGIEAGPEILNHVVQYLTRGLAACKGKPSARCVAGRLVLTPRVMQLRRLVIGEVGRFPELARALFEGGPRRAIAAMAVLFERLAERGLIAIDDPAAAASQFNWLIMGEPLSSAMLLGDEAIPKPAELRRHAAAGVHVFLASYGK